MSEISQESQKLPWEVFFSAEDRQYISTLVREELVPRLERIAWESAVWEKYHKTEPTPAKRAKQLLAIEKRINALVQSLECLPQATRDLVFEVYLMQTRRGLRSLVEDLRSLGIGLHFMRRKSRALVTSGRPKETAIRSLAWQLGEALEECGYKLEKSRDGVFFQVFELLTETIGHPLEDPFSYILEAIDGLRGKTTSE